MTFPSTVTHATSDENTVLTKAVHPIVGVRVQPNAPIGGNNKQMRVTGNTRKYSQQFSYTGRHPPVEEAMQVLH